MILTIISIIVFIIIISRPTVGQSTFWDACSCLKNFCYQSLTKVITERHCSWHASLYVKMIGENEVKWTQKSELTEQNPVRIPCRTSSPDRRTQKRGNLWYEYLWVLSREGDLLFCVHGALSRGQWLTGEAARYSPRERMKHVSQSVLRSVENDLSGLLTGPQFSDCMPERKIRRNRV